MKQPPPPLPPPTPCASKVRCSRCVQVELVPGGSSKAVTADNVVEYIHRVADYRLNYQIKGASEAFWGGFFDLVARDWVTMFNEEEVQMLVSGGGEGVDIADMQAHVHYAGGYHEAHPIILDFWKASLLFLSNYTISCWFCC